MAQLSRVLDVTTNELLTGRTNEVRLVPVKERKSLDDLTLQVYVNSADGDRVKLNIPMMLVKISMELGVDMTASGSLKDVDVQKIVELVERVPLSNW